jgi:TRAP-type C4-dicarboxylate transport system permease small subunit
VADADLFASHRALVMQRHRHLKWPALDRVEALLMVLCGVCMFGFTMCAFFDVVTRTIGRPWLWLQQLTTAFFAWGVFVGMAAATRRMDHIYLAEMTRRMRGARRQVLETANRLIQLAIAGFMIWFGVQNALHDLGSFRMPSLIPLTVYTAIVPVAGVLIALFTVEQVINGLRNGYAGPEDTELTGEPVE